MTSSIALSTRLEKLTACTSKLEKLSDSTATDLQLVQASISSVSQRVLALEGKVADLQKGVTNQASASNKASKQATSEVTMLRKSVTTMEKHLHTLQSQLDSLTAQFATT